MPTNRRPRDKGPDRGQPNPLFRFGEPEEITNRGDDAALGGFDIGEHPASFRQIAPNVATGQSINRPVLQHSGHGNRKKLGPGS